MNIKLNLADYSIQLSSVLYLKESITSSSILYLKLLIIIDVSWVGKTRDFKFYY